ncbi:WAT1-related protein At5g07050 isoform X2 [Cryptomeria japonica]|uniref:WAT1-related protein At5g07050 isoform X2 n=1 Tax=Cryptomeria japonica TaxID=3369 RepID=UPI0025AC2D4A|nr:WAT1-related protein At5g07050 isoform X2 [Cryptomeria japonica]
MAEIGSSCCVGLAPLYEKSKPVLAMISIQFGYAGMNIISKVALNQGMSHFTLVFYRKTRPKLTFGIFCQIFLSALLGATINQNFYYAGLDYTSTTFACAISNIVPALTFLMAIPLRLERVGIRTSAGQAKVLGTIVCVGGAMFMTVYKGMAIQLWTTHIHVSEGQANASQPKDWIKGSLLIVGSCIFWSSWFIMQAKISNKYSAQYSSTALMCFLVVIQSGVITLIFEGRNPSVWAIGWDLKLLTAIYSGVVTSAISVCVMSWCILKRGPLFVTMFSPLLMVIVAVMSSIVLDEKLHLGSVIGSVLIIIGLYSVLWGKGKEMEKVTKTLKGDSVESLSGHDLSNHSGCEISYTKKPTKSPTKEDPSNNSNNNTAIQETSIDCSGIDKTILEDQEDDMVITAEETHKQIGEGCV